MSILKPENTERCKNTKNNPLKTKNAISKSYDKWGLVFTPRCAREGS